MYLMIFVRVLYECLHTNANIQYLYGHDLVRKSWTRPVPTMSISNGGEWVYCGRIAFHIDRCQKMYPCRALEQKMFKTPTDLC